MTAEEYLKTVHQGHHVTLVCSNHPNAFYSCKSLSVSVDKRDGTGRYNGMRSLFHSHGNDCPCGAGNLVLVIPESNPASEL